MLQVSFYALPSSVLGNDKHSLLREAYCWYLFADTTTLPDLLNDALILAKRLDFDVFNALDVLENDTFLKVATCTAACNLPFRLQPALQPAAPSLQPRAPGLQQPRASSLQVPTPNPSPGPNPQP